jgi:hypothetical protein
MLMISHRFSLKATSAKAKGKAIIAVKRIHGSKTNKAVASMLQTMSTKPHNFNGTPGARAQ